MIQTIGIISVTIFLLGLLIFQYIYLVDNENKKEYSKFDNIINFIPFLPLILLILLLFFYVMLYLITKPFIKN